GTPGNQPEPGVSIDAEPVEEGLVAAPRGADAHLEVEEDLIAELLLQLSAGRRADLLDLVASLADQDPFLRFGLGPDVGLDADQLVVTGLDLGDLDLHRVRKLLAGAHTHS